MAEPKAIIGRGSVWAAVSLRPAQVDAVVVIEARGVSKTFRVPDQRIDSIKERVTHPLTRVTHRELEALRDVSFDIHRGEFFGIVGRNGSGKSTLLKILASIYAADHGTVRMAGRVAPFIELGVGFNPELVARENVVLNGVLMGLSRREAIRRFDAVLDFAELGDFAEVKIKNYSSGMMVRLAFAIMVQADADIMLVDEVLAVGDAAFAQKCMDVFHARRDAGRTVVLVTHDMSTVQSMCHRALLLHDGEQRFLGDPTDAAVDYYRLNFARPAEDGAGMAVPDYNVAVEHAWLRDDAGTAVEGVEEGRPLRLDIRLRALRDFRRAVLAFQLRTEDHVLVHQFDRYVEDTIAQGETLTITGSVENRLVPGRYRLDCWVRRHDHAGDLAMQAVRLLEFMVFGATPPRGVVTHETDVVLQRDGVA
jgi:ABC-2 type transport system ATP-binding protein